MDQTDVVAVVGTCGAERLRHAKRLAVGSGRAFVPAQRLRRAEDPIAESLALARWNARDDGVVVEFPDDAPVAEIIGAFAEDDATRLTGILCIVDAAHLLADLGAGVCPRAGRRPPRAADGAHAMRTVAQLEYASTIVLVSWERLDTHALSAVMALVCHLSPHARLRLHRGPVEPTQPRSDYDAEQERPGWISLLNGEFDPHMTDPRVSAFRYENIRPLHPLRFKHLLDERIERGEFGTVVRSAGFCRLATRPEVTALWSHAGHAISLEPAGSDADLSDDEEMLAWGQDLAFIGLDLDHAALRAALDLAALSDIELAAGPKAWVRYEDPFPVWRHSPDHAE
ncbi:GTP-binding protein [Microbacterium sp. NPDC096154]|uniref:GTP-binding protein n=1 Tax=Microbacterium sp. NPDC096154 TaxID=3155549 RepID=UPI003320D470